ncbi:MAG: type I secretion protein TolC [Micavibrio aeruginosavorus]|uniref:Type I secretion protein TolC n=1 Tax=Micavibrio aeruginosavorus TaxID=349221 RepID=A0A2W5BXC1_9BACT|nr:MAG: type I secretion protein TolC [Micavibrio aeruginosavorus]
MSRILVFLTALFLSHNAFAEERAMSLHAVLQEISRDNPTIQAARFNMKAAEEEYPQARAGWLPRASAEANLTATDIKTGNFSAGDGATTKGAVISVEQNIFRGFRTQAEMEGAKERIEASRERLKQVEQDVFSRAVRAYMDVIRARLVLSLQQKNIELLSGEKKSIRARYDAGDVTQTDIKQTEARYANALADSAIALSNLNDSETAFEELTGRMPENYMEMPSIPFQFPETAQALAALAERNNPQIARSRYEQKAAEQDIDVERSGHYPQVTAFASYAHDRDPQPGIVDKTEVGTIGVRARIALYEGGATQSRIREAKSRASQQFVEIVEARRAVVRSLVSKWKKLASYDAEISARELEVSAKRFSSEGVREEAKLGERTVQDTLEADQAVLDAEIGLVTAKHDRIVTGYELAADLGLLTSEGLGFQRKQPAPAE